MAAAADFPSGVPGIAKTIAPADATNFVDVYDNSAGSKSVRVEALAITSSDTSTVNIQFARYSGSATYPIGTVRAVTLSGLDGATPKVFCLPAIGHMAPDGIYVIEVPAGQKLQAKSLVQVTADKAVHLSGWVRSYA
jgi:hypothetical protein